MSDWLGLRASAILRTRSPITWVLWADGGSCDAGGVRNGWEPDTSQPTLGPLPRPTCVESSSFYSLSTQVSLLPFANALPAAQSILPIRSVIVENSAASGSRSSPRLKTSFRENNTRKIALPTATSLLKRRALKTASCAFCLRPFRMGALLICTHPVRTAAGLGSVSGRHQVPSGVVVSRLVLDAPFTGHLPNKRSNDEKRDVDVGGARTPPSRECDARFSHDRKLKGAASLEMVFGIKNLLEHERRNRG